MSKKPAPPSIRVRGARQNNLKNLDLDLPLGKLIVVTGLSGSGKSSLAFDTLFAEGQRRYVETFSPYARQFLDRMDKPRVDRIENIPPAIAIEQRNAVRSTRSTVGTMTELTEFAKLLWLHLGRLRCRQCGRPVVREHPPAIWERLTNKAEKTAGEEALVTFEVPLSQKVSLEESLELIARQGYRRLLVEGRIVPMEEAGSALQETRPTRLCLVQDRLRLAPSNRSRFMDAAAQAFHFGKGKLTIRSTDLKFQERFSNHLHCADCDLSYQEPVAALFSFNHPLGACPTCRGFGRTITIDYDRAIPDRSLSLEAGAVRPWRTGTGAESQRDMGRFCRKRGVPMDVPFAELPADMQNWVIDGDPGYGSDAAHRWPRAWYGVKGYFRWLETKAYKMHVRVLLSNYRAYIPCPSCRGRRFQPDTLLYEIEDGAGRPLNLSHFYELPVAQALSAVEEWLTRQGHLPKSSPLRLALEEMQGRLQFLAEAGLGYLTLDRPTRSLSGGETERVNLTTCLGSRLVNTLFVLDEPSVGLHARDTDRLARILQRLRDAGNTVVAVEHDPRIMRAADEIIDLGPGHGAAGGHLVFQGDWKKLLKKRDSLTGQYLGGVAKFPPNRGRSQVSDRTEPSLAAGEPRVTIRHASRHNLKDLTVEIPLRRLVCLTGVSGSGKTTLVKQVLMPLLATRLAPSARMPVEEEFEDEIEADRAAGETRVAAELTGTESLQGFALVDQSALGRTPRSTPALYVGAFDSIRDLFARTPDAKDQGLKASAFSFNSAAGQCERCRGAGFEKIEMQFLSDVYIRCPDCDGKRYQGRILDLELRPRGNSEPGWNIAQALEATVDEAIDFLEPIDHPAGGEARRRLRRLQETGLGYLQLGQPINTLSGGECQRLKLARRLADSKDEEDGTFQPTLFMFDEPTTGLHFDDVRVLIEVFQRLVDDGHSVLVIEHNLDVVRAADWVIDLGPEGGEAGGRLVASGPPAVIVASESSQTGAALRADAAQRGGGSK